MPFNDPFSLGSIVYIVILRRASVTNNKYFKYVKETIVTENNFWRVYSEWGQTAFATREDAEREANKRDS